MISLLGLEARRTRGVLMPSLLFLLLLPDQRRSGLRMILNLVSPLDPHLRTIQQPPRPLRPRLLDLSLVLSFFVLRSTNATLSPASTLPHRIHLVSSLPFDSSPAFLRGLSSDSSFSFSFFQLKHPLSTPRPASGQIFRFWLVFLKLFLFLMSDGSLPMFRGKKVGIRVRNGSQRDGFSRRVDFPCSLSLCSFILPTHVIKRPSSKSM